VVHSLDTNPAKVNAARKHIRSKGLYGKVSADEYDGKRLPYADNLINLMVVDKAASVPREEVLRVLAPYGMAFIGAEKVVKPWPEEMDEWSHYLYGPNNNAVADGTTISSPRSLRWSAGKPWGRSHDQITGTHAMVSAKGIMYYIFDDAPLHSVRYKPQWKLIARDAFNGTRLWEQPIPEWINHMRWFRAGPTHLTRRLVAADDHIYVTMGITAPVSKLDGRTGKTLKVYPGTEHAEEIIYKDGVLYVLVGTSEISITVLHKYAEKPDFIPTEERHLVAIDAESGNELWRKNARDENYILPLGYAVNDNKVYIHSIKALECLSADTGKPLWETACSVFEKRYAWSTSTLVATDEVILLADRSLAKAKSKGKSSANSKEVGAAAGNITWAITQIGIDGIAQKNAACELTAYDAANGGELWKIPVGEGYNSPADVFVVENVVWPGPEFAKGYDLKTGKVVREIPSKGDAVGMVHHRCYRNKVTGNYILRGKDGIEAIDLHKGWVGNNSWLRGACAYGVMPANGLTYVPPDACGCHPHVKLQGFNALGSTIPQAVFEEPAPHEERLIKGEAYPRLAELCSDKNKTRKEDWPAFRHDSSRSGMSQSDVTDSLQQTWITTLSGRLSQPVAAHSMVFVSSIDEYTVHALDGKTGKQVWSVGVGSRVDSPPTVYRGLLVFGSADGYVHCLEAATGKLAWRFRAAPGEHLISYQERLESSWPVRGSVLVEKDTLCFTAGRNSYMDGGLYYYQMDPATGKVLATNLIRHLDPVTGVQTGIERNGYAKFDSEGVLSDILSSDGKSVFLKHMQFDFSGEEEHREKIHERTPHLYSPGGFLGEHWYMRTYWLFGTQTKAGYGGWGRKYSGSLYGTPYGRIMCFNEDRIFSYGRLQTGPDPSGKKHDLYHLFSSLKIYKPAVEGPTTIDLNEFPKGIPVRKENFWSTPDFDLIVRAMALTPTYLVLAGPKDVAKRSEDEMAFENNDEALAAYTGKRGAELYLQSISDGKTIQKLSLPAMPVFDGLIVADKRVFVSLVDGTILSLDTK
jgi:outer membrane protein assembly factor BamB